MTPAEFDTVQDQLRAAEAAEELKTRLDREHRELLEELRALIPGATVLLGILLSVSFSDRFDELVPFERYVYYLTLVSLGVALVLYLAPAAHHRLRFREADKDYSVRKGNREAIAGTVATSIALTGVIYLVTDRVFGNAEAIVVSIAFFVFLAWRWWAAAVYRALRQRRRSPRSG